MRCLLPLILLLGAAHAGPFFKLRFGTPEHRSDPEGGPVLDGPTEAFPQEMPEGSAAVFSLQVPKIDLSDLFKPLRVFAGVNVNHPMVISVREEEPNCDLGKFDLTDKEFEVVMDCQELVEGDEVGLRECILTKLPETNVELREFLDREEFGVASLSSSFHLALLNGEFTQKRSVQFRLCPRDEVNSIDGGEPVTVVEEIVPMVEEMVPIEALNPDRVDMTEPEVVAHQPVAPPLFQFPALKLPDFGQIFTEAFAPVFRPQPAEEEGDATLGLFGSHLNPFAIRHPPAAAGPQQGFFASLFPALAATPPPQGPPDGIDMTDCTSKKFDVSRFVFNVANRCQYANDYRKCLEVDLADDKSARDLLEFAANPSYSVIASSFSSFQTTFDLEALHANKGVLDLTRKNQIDLRRCANIVEEEVPETSEAAPEEAVSPSAPAPEAAEEASGVPEAAPEVTPQVTPEVAPEVTPEAAPEVTPEVAPEVAPEVTPEVAPEVAPEVTPEVAPEVTPEVTPEVVSEVAEAGPEEIPVVLTEYPSKTAPGAEVTLEVDPEGHLKIISINPEDVEMAPEVPVEPTADAEKEVIVAQEAEKASVEVEKAPAETEKAPEKAEVEKAAMEAEKAAAGVENPSEESKPAQSKDSTQTDYAVAEP